MFHSIAGSHLKLLSLCIFFLLTSCSHSDPWAFNRIDSGDPQFNSSKLTFYSKDPINGIDLEFVQTCDHLRTYLNVHSFPVPALKDDPKASKVHLLIGTDNFHFLASRHQGGQRLLLPPEMAERIIAGLREHQPIHIKVPGYSVAIEEGEFEKKFKQLGHTPLLRNPFHFFL